MAELVPIPNAGVPEFYGQHGDPVVVVLHDWYGRLPGVGQFAEALASRGLRVAVPDLYEGVCTVDAAAAEELMGRLEIGGALASIDDAIVEAQETGVERVGLVGFSMGGWLALLHAQAGAADAVVGYYASLARQDHGVIPCPVLLHWAENDVGRFRRPGVVRRAAQRPRHARHRAPIPGHGALVRQREHPGQDPLPGGRARLRTNRGVPRAHAQGLA